MMPFDPLNPRWRESKLENAPRSADDLIVEVRDPLALTAAEHAALIERLIRCNMAVYASRARINDDSIVRGIARQFGLVRLDSNWLANEDGISEITVRQEGTRKNFIPYTNRPIKWHTDGYYNPPERKIRGMILHCAANAAQGGENRLLDHEMAYLLLNDEDPSHTDALMRPDAMTIPERVDADDGVRQAQTGPVFSIEADRLHMRYTARTLSIEWKQDEATLRAAARLEKLLASASPYIYRLKLEPGQGLICNNVLHERMGFADDEGKPRLLYRARYYDRIEGT